MLQTPVPVDFTVPPQGVPSAPRSVDICVTGRCNLSCRYCFYADTMKGKKDLPTERWVNFFQELGSLGVQRVSLSGGEVFTRPDLFPLIDEIVANRMRYGILSNGTLITDTVVARLAEKKRRLRLDSIQVSIDGSSAAIHDFSRPPKSFDRAVRGLQLLVDAKLPATARVTLNRHNTKDLENIARFLLEDIRLQSFSTNEAMQMGAARCRGSDIVLSSDERRQAMRKLTELSERYEGRISASAGPLALARMVSDVENRLARGEAEAPGYGTLCSCRGVFSKMAVLHDGTMVPCDLLPTLIMGVIGMHALQDVWLNSPAINVVRRRGEIELSVLSECSGCPYSRFCTGGCPAIIMATSGKLIGIDPLTCYRTYKGD
ncbi:MAG: radical SAM protein [Halobacteriota archaeon]